LQLEWLLYQSCKQCVSKMFVFTCLPACLPAYLPARLHGVIIQQTTAAKPWILSLSCRANRIFILLLHWSLSQKQSCCLKLVLHWKQGLHLACSITDERVCNFLLQQHS
jgi:hypothetical protein